MPFRSAKQRRYMYARHPKIAATLDEEVRLQTEEETMIEHRAILHKTGSGNLTVPYEGNLGEGFLLPIAAYEELDGPDVITITVTVGADLEEGARGDEPEPQPEPAKPKGDQFTTTQNQHVSR